MGTENQRDAALLAQQAKEMEASRLRGKLNAALDDLDNLSNSEKQRQLEAQQFENKSLEAQWALEAQTKKTKQLESQFVAAQEELLHRREVQAREHEAIRGHVSGHRQ